MEPIQVNDPVYQDVNAVNFDVNELRRGLLPNEFLMAFYTKFVYQGEVYDIAHFGRSETHDDPTLICLSASSKNPRGYKTVETLVSEEVGGKVHRREKFHTTFELAPGLTQAKLVDLVGHYNRRFNNSVGEMIAQFENIPHSILINSPLYPDRLIVI